MTDYTNERIDWLLAEIAEVEAYMEQTDLTASEQDSLLKDWRELQTLLTDAYEEAEKKAEQYDPNNWVDDREGCERCSGCAYCMETPAYDGADEI